MARKLTDSPRFAVAFLALFALPFTAVGAHMTWKCTRAALRHSAMQAWVEVPATIRQTDFKVHHGDESETFQVTAVYDYEFGGRKFSGTRVGLYTGSDSAGNFQRAAYDELKRHRDQQKPFRCYVNPSDPSEAVLYRQLRGEMLVFYTGFAAFFGAFGLALVTAAIAVSHRTPKQPAGDLPADQPWLSKPEWATGNIRQNAGRAVGAIIIGVVALYWLIALLPMFWKLPEIMSQDTGYRWVAIAFIAIGLVLFAVFAHQLFGALRFGESTVQMASVPGVIGGQFAGVIHIPRSIAAPQGFRLKLSCIEHTGSGDDKKEVLLWQDERFVTEPIRDDATGTTALPFLFAIPFDSKESMLEDDNPCVEWRLDASATLSGVDYKSQFDVPIFKTADSSPDFKLDEALFASYAKPPDKGLVLDEAGIVRQPLPGEGVRFVFPAARKWKAAFLATLILVLWFGFVWLLIHLAAPILVPIVFTLFGLAIAWGALDMWLYRSVVEAQQNELRVRGGWFGLGREHSFAASEIRELTTSQNMSSGANVWKDIIVVPREGKKRTIAKSISSVLAQQLVIDELKAAVARPIGEAAGQAK